MIGQMFNTVTAQFKKRESLEGEVREKLTTEEFRDLCEAISTIQYVKRLGDKDMVKSMGLTNQIVQTFEEADVEYRARLKALKEKHGLVNAHVEALRVNDLYIPAKHVYQPVFELHNECYEDMDWQHQRFH